MGFTRRIVLARQQNIAHAQAKLLGAYLDYPIMSQTCTLIKPKRPCKLTDIQIRRLLDKRFKFHLFGKIGIVR